MDGANTQELPPASHAPEVRQRPRSAAVEAAAIAGGYTPLQAKIIAARVKVPEGIAAIGRPIHDLDPPDTLPDIDKAGELIAAAIVGRKQKLVLCTDSDCDGSSAHFVLRAALLDYFGVSPEQILSFIANRNRDGYGVSDGAVDRMLAVVPQGSLCITADQGSSDEARIARMRAERGVLTVVTDHHAIPAEGPPKSAAACVSPIRKDSQFPDPFIAGCHVAWLTMCAVRQRLIACGYLPKDAPSLAPLLDVVAAGTCADAVSLGASRNNRSILAYGIKRMNRANARPCWEAMRVVMNKLGPLTVRDVSHGIAPRINARGRLGDAMASVKFLCAKSLDEALPLAKDLDQDNLDRREIQKAMTGPALELGAKESGAGRAAIVVHLVDGHSGVQGIVASRLVETYGRPVCCLSPDHNHAGMVAGSLRSIPGVDIRAALACVADENPGLLAHFGGHPGAAGLALREEDIQRFRDALCVAVERQADPSQFLPVIWTDGALGTAPSMDAIREIEALEPYGREFEAPTFTDEFIIAKAKPVGDGTHLKLEVADEAGNRYGGIWFRAMEAGATPPVGAGEAVTVVYTLSANTFRNETKAELLVSSARPLPTNGSQL